MNLIALPNNRVARVVSTADHRSTYSRRNVYFPVWKFNPGDHLYARDLLGSVVVVERVAGLAWPHYTVMNDEGQTFGVSQLLLSTTDWETLQSGGRNNKRALRQQGS